MTVLEDYEKIYKLTKETRKKLDENEDKFFDNLVYFFEKVEEILDNET